MSDKCIVRTWDYVGLFFLLVIVVQKAEKIFLNKIRMVFKLLQNNTHQ